VYTFLEPEIRFGEFFMEDLVPQHRTSKVVLMLIDDIGREERIVFKEPNFELTIQFDYDYGNENDPPASGVKHKTISAQFTGKHYE